MVYIWAGRTTVFTAGCATVINRCDAWYMAIKPGYGNAIIYFLNWKYYVVVRDIATLLTLDMVESSRSFNHQNIAFLPTPNDIENWRNAQMEHITPIFDELSASIIKEYL